MDKRIIFSLLILFLIVGTLFFVKIINSPSTKKIEVIPTQKTSVKNYSDCVSAGYPVLDSNPSRCGTPDGKMFIEE